VQRHAAFGVLFDTGNFGTAEAATALHLDTFDTHAHGALDGALHGAAEGNTLFELAGDVFSDELGIRFGALDFVDADVDFLTGEELEFALEAFEFFALLTDDDTRAGGKEVDIDLLDGTFDADLGKGGDVRNASSGSDGARYLRREDRQTCLRHTTWIPNRG
jgi:hypothetical protein